MKMKHPKIFLAMVTVLSLTLLGVLPATADHVILDDLIVDGSACIGHDCVNGEDFQFDTLRFRENNLRIKFDDTSSIGSYPNNDWQITANDSNSGGANKFSIDDISNNRTPFTIEASAPNHSLFVDDGGKVGLGTSTPSTRMHSVYGDTPTLRLEQDNSWGWGAQAWDLAGNETSFFIRDVTHASKLPFRIFPNAPSSSLIIEEDTGDIGLGTLSPDDDLDIQADGPGIAFNNTGTGGGAWNFYVNGNTGNLNIRPALSGSVIPFKMNTTAQNNLLRVGVVGSDRVDIDGELYITGDCEEDDGACADYVFEPDYKLRSLDDLQAFIKDKKHLPNVPSAETIQQKGVNMAHMSGRLLEKIEELTLYTLQQQEQIRQQKQQIQALVSRLTALESQ